MPAIDQIYQCRMPGQDSGIWQVKCHLQIFQSGPHQQTVMLTDMGFEFGWFIPYVTAELATQIVREFDLDPAKLLWIEHYTPRLRRLTSADFSQLTFDWHNKQATNPRWSAIAPQTLQALIKQELLPV